MLDEPGRVIDGGADQRRTCGESQGIDDDAPRDRARLAAAPDRVDFPVDLHDQQDRCKDHEERAYAFELRGLLGELGKVMPYDAAAAGEKVAQQKGFEGVLPALEHRKSRDVAERDGEQRHQAKERREGEARRRARDAHAREPTQQPTQEGKEGEYPSQHPRSMSRRAA
jgi:hypothetical protein